MAPQPKEGWTSRTWFCLAARFGIVVCPMAGVRVATAEVYSSEGCPCANTNAAVTPVQVSWGPFEPFGRDTLAGSAFGATESGIYLRFPGQWDDGTWAEAGSGAELSYNVHRWYETGTGRYSRVDPLGVEGDFHPYTYASSAPLLLIDPTGERARVCCRPVRQSGVESRFFHCFIEVQDDETGRSTTYGVHRVRGRGCKYQDAPFDRGAPRDDRAGCGKWNESCESDSCASRQFALYPNPSDYQLVRGPNSNSFASTVSDACSLPAPNIAGTDFNTPGWGREGRPLRKPFRCLPTPPK